MVAFLDKISRVFFRGPPKSALNLSRNDPCWCGSGKKYKRCHYDSDRKHWASRGTSCKPSS